MIRLAEFSDLDRITEIYRIAREFMRRNGNENQWGDAYPPRSMLENDIRNKQLYVLCKDKMIHGVFAFIIGDDPAYAHIENGSWKNNGIYGAIHRIASDGTVKGVFHECLDYCKNQIDNIRIDTHENNTVMRHLIEKHGFEKRGLIYLEDGSPRIAYELNI